MKTLRMGGFSSIQSFMDSARCSARPAGAIHRWAGDATGRSGDRIVCLRSWRRWRVAAVWAALHAAGERKRCCQATATQTTLAPRCDGVFQFSLRRDSFAAPP